MRIGWITIEPPRIWLHSYRGWLGPRCYIFRNRDGIRPGRWGFQILGFAFGSRNPGNWFGVLLKRIGLWPW